MGCEVSRSIAVDVQTVRRNSNADMGLVTELDDYQIDIIGSTLPLLRNDAVKHGCAVFLDVFTVEPKVKRLFPFRTSDLESLSDNETFRHHARMFMDVVMMVCDNVNQFSEDSDVSRELMLLGAQHATIGGCELMYFDIFAKCLHLTWEAVLGEEYTDDVRVAWTVIFQFIVGRMREGFVVYMQQQTNGNAANHVVVKRTREQRGSIEEEYALFNKTNHAMESCM